MGDPNNPFEALHANLENDLFEIDLNCFSPVYRQLIGIASNYIEDPKKIIDLVPRTGISTYLLQRRFPDADIFTIEPNQRSAKVLRHKLGIEKLDMGKIIERGALTLEQAEKLQDYWDSEVSKINSDKIHVMADDLQTSEEYIFENSDFILHPSASHWTYRSGGEEGLKLSFELVHNYLKPGGILAFNSFMDFCEPTDPNSKNFVNHPLVNELRQNVITAIADQGYEVASIPTQPMNTTKYKAILEDAGLKLIRGGDIKMPYDMIKFIDGVYKARFFHEGLLDSLPFSQAEKDAFLEDVMDETLEYYVPDPIHAEYAFSVNPAFIARKVA